MHSFLWSSLILSLLACDTPETRQTPPPTPDLAHHTESPAETAAARVVLQDARVRAQPPGSANSAAFMTIRNPGPATTLVGAEGTVATAIELHTHTPDEAGVMQMRQIERIDLPAAGEVTLQPGGLHVMLIGLQQDLVEGGQVDLTLIFEDGSRKPVSLPVKAIEVDMGHPQHASVADAPSGDGATCSCGGGEGGGSCTCGEGACTCGGGDGSGHGKADGHGEHGGHH